MRQLTSITRFFPKRMKTPSWRLTAVAAITMLAVFAISLIATKYSELQGRATFLQGMQFRTSIQLVRELGRLGTRVDLIDPAEGPMGDGLNDFEQAVDFLFVQFTPFKEGLNTLEQTEAAEDLAISLQAVLDFADIIISNTAADPSAYEMQFRVLLDNAQQQALAYVNDQFQIHAVLVEQKERMLGVLAAVAIGLTILFSLIAFAAVLLFEREARSNDQRRAAERRVAYLAHYDTLTGLPKRARFKVESTRILEQKERTMVMLVDVDDFKHVNDTYGHAMGDQVLKHVAGILKKVTGEAGGAAARLGGDEFAAVFPGPISSMRASSICEALINEINLPVTLDNVQITQRISVGVAISHMDVDPNSDDLLSEMMKSADVALYQSKDEGKNTYAFFDSTLAERVARRRKVETGLTDAIRNHGFTLHYQPQVDMRDGTVIGFEALVRWDWNGERMSPAEFIPIAEDTGQVVEIDYICMREAAQTMREWMDAGLPPAKMSTNLSALHFRDEKIIDRVAEVLRETGLPPHLLTLEVTESVMIENVQRVVSIIACLKQLGVTVALDDFGTGYSSLAYLRMLPVDFIKIDQSFVRDLEDSLETQIVMQSLVGLIHGLSRKIVVEGVESSLQSAMIRQMGCDFGQGYFYGKPMETPEARETLAAGQIEAARSA